MESITPKRCKKCGGTEFNKHGRCKFCRAAIVKRYNHLHKAEQAAWYFIHRNDMVARSKKYHQEHKEELMARSKKYRQENKERRTVYGIKYRQEHKEELKVYNRKYFQEHKEKIRIKNILRRTKKNNNGGAFTLEQWEKLTAHYTPEDKCLCCGEKKSMTADHIIPIAQGGTSNIENIQPLCQSCNSSKNNKIIDYRPDCGASFWEADK